MTTNMKLGLVFGATIVLSGLVVAQNSPSVVSTVDDSVRVTLPGSSLRLAQLSVDAGLVDPGLKMDRLVLVLGSSSEQERALLKLSGDSSHQPSTSSVVPQVVTGSQQLRVAATSGGQAQTVGINLTLQ